MAMELANVTGFPALLFRTAIDQTRMAAAVVARVTYRIAPGGQLTRAEEQPWGVSRAPWEGPAGPMPSDEVFYRGGVDLFVFGEAWAPGGRPVSSGQVQVRVRDRFEDRVEATLAVFGDRVWTGRAGALKMSPPAPFASMPLVLSRAYGGAAAWDGLQVPFPGNPAGKGFCLSEEQAAGAALPNLEDPRCPVRRWNDAPEPVGTAICPAWWPSRVQAGLTVDAQGRLTALRGRYFNDAFPALVAPTARPGDIVELEGVTPDGALGFVIPPPPLVAEVSAGAARLEGPLNVDQIGVEPALRRVFITYRHAFRYTVTARQRRTCALRALGGN